MQKFCFLCGKRTDYLMEGYCRDCYKKEFKLLKIPQELSFIVCSKCDKFKIGNRWKEKKLFDLIREKIKTAADNVEIFIEKHNDAIHIYAKGFVGKSKKEEKYHLYVHLNKVVCSDCTRKYGGYYESIMQLRGEFNENIINFIKMEFEYIEKRDKKAFFRIKEVKGGIDFYIGSKSAAEKISKLLRTKFNAEIKRSFKMHGRKEGRTVYRHVISVRI